MDWRASRLPPPPLLTPRARKIPAVRRKSVGAAQEDWVTIRPLSAEAAFPTLITPNLEGLDLVEWVAGNRDFVQRLWEERRALLFRGFELDGIEGVRRLTEIAADGPRLPYLDRSTPREEYAPGLYSTTIFPQANTIRLHNEGSYWTAHPQKAFFACIMAPETGGETPIGDVHAVHERIDPEIREEFARRKWMLARNYHHGFALPWQEVFQTTDRSEVEAYCATHRIDFEWRDGDRLRTTQVREPILRHPRTGEPLWHNHAAFFHITTREPRLREALQREFADEDLPYNTYYGDGGEIDPDVIRHINAAYDAETVMFPWQRHDVTIVDNLRLAHARQPFTGERLILVALTEPYVPPQAPG